MKDFLLLFIFLSFFLFPDYFGGKIGRIWAHAQIMYEIVMIEKTMDVEGK